MRVLGLAHVEIWGHSTDHPHSERARVATLKDNILTTGGGRLNRHLLATGRL